MIQVDNGYIAIEDIRSLRWIQKPQVQLAEGDIVFAPAPSVIVTYHNDREEQFHCDTAHWEGIGWTLAEYRGTVIQ
jgi:hypothetical protein